MCDIMMVVPLWCDIMMGVPLGCDIISLDKEQHNLQEDILD